MQSVRCQEERERWTGQMGLKRWLSLFHLTPRVTFFLLGLKKLTRQKKNDKRRAGRDGGLNQARGASPFTRV